MLYLPHIHGKYNIAAGWGSPGERTVMAESQSEALAAVKAHVEAFNADDLDAVVAGFAEDAVFANGDQLIVGRRGIGALFGQALGQVQATLDLRGTVTEGESVACELTERVTIGGQTFEFDLAGFFTVRGGLIRRAKIYREGAAEGA